MRIGYTTIPHNPYGQFVIYAEGKIEEAVLANFVKANKEGYRLRLAGYAGGTGYEGVTSFIVDWYN